MRMDTTAHLTLPPALIGAALDCLGHLPDGYRLDPTLLAAIARAIGCSSGETPALLTRIRAAAIVMNDPRWPVWMMSLKSASPEQRQAFELTMLRAIAALPLTQSLAFDARDFFDALLVGVIPASRT